VLDARIDTHSLDEGGANPLRRPGDERVRDQSDGEHDKQDNAEEKDDTTGDPTAFDRRIRVKAFCRNRGMVTQGTVPNNLLSMPRGGIGGGSSADLHLHLQPKILTP